MCFSAPVSFAAAAVLTVSGAVGTQVAARREKRFIPINALAFCFAIQQFLEGVIWTVPSWAETPILAKIFLFFALFVYPWFVGASFYVLTRNPKRRNVLAGFIGGGFLYGILIYGSVLIAPGFNVDLAGAHIAYQHDTLGISEQLTWGLFIPLYVILTIAPFFICDRPYAWAVGLAVFITALLSAYVYTNYFVSVWCFFAAIASLAISFWTYKTASRI